MSYQYKIHFANGEYPLCGHPIWSELSSGGATKRVEESPKRREIGDDVSDDAMMG